MTKAGYHRQTDSGETKQEDRLVVLSDRRCKDDGCGS